MAWVGQSEGQPSASLPRREGAKLGADKVVGCTNLLKA